MTAKPGIEAECKKTTCNEIHIKEDIIQKKGTCKNIRVCCFGAYLACNKYSTKESVKELEVNDGWILRCPECLAAGIKEA